MPFDLTAALEAADNLRGYETGMLSSLVSCLSVRAEASDVHELCAKQLEGLGMEVELVVPPGGRVGKPPRVVSPKSGQHRTGTAGKRAGIIW